jgi:hypothetical protein
MMTCMNQIVRAFLVAQPAWPPAPQRLAEHVNSDSRSTSWRSSFQSVRTTVRPSGERALHDHRGFLHCAPSKKANASRTVHFLAIPPRMRTAKHMGTSTLIRLPVNPAEFQTGSLPDAFSWPSGRWWRRAREGRARPAGPRKPSRCGKRIPWVSSRSLCRPSRFVRMRLHSALPAPARRSLQTA